jgi:hypothetical protein
MTIKTPDFTERCFHEAETHRLVWDYRQANPMAYNDANAYTIQAVLNLFKMHWSSSYTPTQIQRICVATTPGMVTDDAERFQKVLTKLARAKVLRSRTQDGKSFYEVNY